MMKRVETLRVKLAKQEKKREDKRTQTQLAAREQGPLVLADNDSVFTSPNVTYSY